MKINEVRCDLCDQRTTNWSRCRVDLRKRPPGASGGEVTVYADFTISPVGGTQRMDLCTDCEMVVRVALEKVMKAIYEVHHG